MGERLSALRAERAALQARADGEARIGLLRPFRVASLLADALAARGEAERERVFDRLPSDRRQAFAAADALNAALKDALGRPGAGTRQLAIAAAGPAREALERLANAGDFPLVLQFTPRFVPPRRATGELTLAPGAPAAPPSGSDVPLGTGGAAAGTAVVPTVPRYAPAFAATNEDDPAVPIEIVGLRLGQDGSAPPTLTVGAWRGEATVTPERLRFAVPRAAFATEAARTTFVTATLALRRDGRTATFDLVFTVLPDRPGSFALDQKIRTTVPESRTLVSPEILARGGPGEARTVHRCFDPPAEWRFDPARRSVIVVEKLGSQDDIPDATLNAGTVEFASDGKPGQVCVVVSAKPATKTAKVATIGRFEATLLRDRPEDRTERSGVRALDWNEAARVPLDPAGVAWKLYVRLFDEIDREYDGKLAADTPFLRITREPDGGLVLRADPSADP
ncbi:MAG: hypothetical protein JSR24_17330 [Proteobacteria bacterium]|nr:hypothetical protein [Pseudomonadota bacterium]